MKTMDGGAFEARAVFTGGGNIVDFLALAGVDTAKAICGVRDEFRRSDAELPRLVFADIMVPHQGPGAPAGEVALRMIGGLTGRQAKGLAQAGLRAFVISGNLGEPDSRARYDLPPDQIQRYVAAFIAEVSSR